MTETVRLGPRLGSNSIGALAFAVHFSTGGATLEVFGGRILKNCQGQWT
jgi:hypothetical protein